MCFPMSSSSSVGWCWWWGWSHRVRRVPLLQAFCRGFCLLLPSLIAIIGRPGRALLWEIRGLWRGALRCLCAFGVLLRAGAGSQRYALHFRANHLQFLECLSCTVFEKWKVFMGELYPQKSPILRCCPGLDIGIPTLDDINSPILPAVMLKGNLRSSSTEIGICFFFLLGKSIFQEKVFSQCSSSWEAWRI